MTSILVSALSFSLSISTEISVSDLLECKEGLFESLFNILTSNSTFFFLRRKPDICTDQYIYQIIASHKNIFFPFGFGLLFLYLHQHPYFCAICNILRAYYQNIIFSSFSFSPFFFSLSIVTEFTDTFLTTIPFPPELLIKLVNLVC